MTRPCKVIKEIYHRKVWAITAYNDPNQPSLNREAVPGKDAWQERITIHEHAQFHQWGVDYEENEGANGNYTTAIVELPDGSIITPLANLIQFTDIQ